MILDLLRSKCSVEDFSKLSKVNELTLSKKSAKSNLKLIQQWDEFAIILFRINDEDIVISTAHSVVEHGDCSFDEKREEFNCVVINLPKAEVQHIEFDMETLFKYSIAKKSKVPPLSSVIECESKKEILELHKNLKKNAIERTVKPFVVVPPCIAIEIISSKKRKPFDLLSSTLDSIEKNTS